MGWVKILYKEFLVHGLDRFGLRFDLRRWKDIEVLMISSEENIGVFYPRQDLELVLTTNRQNLALLHPELVIIIASMQH